jgi:pimeloyl-ACP methyl ester carboxylesterase
MDQLGYRRYFLAGHSYGAPVLLQTAIRHPQKVAGISMIAGSISPEMEPESAAWRKWIDLPFLRDILPISMRVSNEELMSLRQDLVMIEDDWDRLDIPVSIIHGTKDVLVPFENLNYAKNKLTNADTIFEKVFEGESHFILWTHKQQIVEELVKLIDASK